jgi:RHS repeat-associated protein
MVIIRVNGTVKQYIHYQWDSDGKPLGFNIREQNASGEWISTSYYFWTNQRSDVMSILDTSGNEIGSYQYDAYGNVLNEEGEIAKENPIRYTGYYYDNETNHYYLKARYYDPENGNFLALDPHPGDDDDPLSQNGYTYAKNNPMMNIDPNGEFAWRGIPNWIVARTIDVAIFLYTGISSYMATKALRTFIKANRKRLIKTVEPQLYKLLGKTATKWTTFIFNLAITVAGTSVGNIVAYVIDHYIDRYLGFKTNNNRCFG